MDLQTKLLWGCIKSSTLKSLPTPTVLPAVKDGVNIIITVRLCTCNSPLPNGSIYGLEYCLFDMTTLQKRTYAKAIVLGIFALQAMLTENIY